MFGKKVAHVEPGNPLQRADHVGLGQGVAGVEHQDERTETGDSGGGRRALESCSNHTEPGLHRDCHGESEEQENTTPPASAPTISAQVKENEILTRTYPPSAADRPRSRG